MNKKNLLISGTILTALILVLVWTSAQPAAPLVQAQAGMGTSTATPATVQVVTDPKLGPILKDEKGMTLYRFMIDTPGASKCTGLCAAAWPPLTIAKGTTPTGSPEVTGKLGTITRPEGSVQVTINGLPLYHFIKDMNPSETNGQGLTAFGGMWWTVKPDGTPNSGMSSPTPAAGSVK